MFLLDQMAKIVLKRIDITLERSQNSPNKDKTDQSILEKLLKINKDIAIVMAFDLLLAGIDTVSETLTYIIFF